MPMHNNEIHIDAKLVASLIESNFPQWKNLPIKRIDHQGTDNAIYRLGDDKLIRLPRVDGTSEIARDEFSLLSYLNRFQLPLEIPKALAIGNPTPNYPNSWVVQSWIEGNPLDSSQLNLSIAARDLGNFIRQLRKIPVDDARPVYRSCPLETRSQAVEQVLMSLKDMVDTKAIRSIWNKCLLTRTSIDSPKWLHADLLPGNFLMKKGKITAVIDFGMSGTGDPACDLIPAWCLFDREKRQIFKDAVGADEDEWIRGKGWALSIGLVIIPYYLKSNPYLVTIAHRMIDQVINE